MRARCVPALLGALLLAGCTRFDVRTNRDPSADLSGPRTWTWLPAALCDPADQRLPDRYLDARLRRTAEARLGEKGYRHVTGGEADLWLNYRFTRDVRSALEIPPRGYGLGWWGRVGHATLETTSEGTLVLDLITTRERTLVWRGMVEAPLVATTSLERRGRRVEAAVNRLLEDFPGD